MGVSSASILLSASDLSGLNIESPDLKLPHFKIELLGRLAFICNMDDGSKYYATIARKIMDKNATNHQKIKFLVEMPDGKLDEIMTCNELSNVISQLHEA
jgi:hypothetical protein